MENTFVQYQKIAELLQNSGYLLLLENVQAYIDDVTYQLEKVSSENEKQLLSKWRALREIYTILATTPEKFAQEVENIISMEEVLKGQQFPGKYTTNFRK